jgi:hypothetical protein
VPIAKPIELLRIDRIDVKSTLQKQLDDRPAGDLDGDGTELGPILSELEQPLDESFEAGARVLDLRFVEKVTLSVERTELMALSAPINASDDRIFFFHHPSPIDDRGLP